MSWKFWRGLFTAHLGTKFLALVLAVLLFTFTHQGLTDQREYDMTLVFKLDKALDGRYVLLQTEIPIEGLVIQALRKQLDDWETRARAEGRLDVRVDESFLRAYPEKRREILDIRISPDFFKEHAILHEALEVVEVPGELRLQIDDRENVEMELAVNEELEKDFLELRPGSPFSPVGAGAGRRVLPSFKPKKVLVSGPHYLLRGVLGRSTPPPLYVRIENVNETIRKRRQEEEIIAARTKMQGVIEAIDWAGSEIRASAEELELLRALDVAAKKLDDVVYFEFEIEQRKDPAVARGLELRIEVAGSVLQGAALDQFLGKYALELGNTELKHNADWTRCDLNLLVPGNLRGGDEFAHTDKFKAVLYFPELPKGEAIEVEVRIVPRDLTDEAAMSILRQIEIKLFEGAERPPAKVRFTPK